MQTAVTGDRQALAAWTGSFVLVASAVLLAATVGAAGAGVQQGTRNIAFDLQLDDVEAVSVDVDDDEEEFVLFEFDGPVDEIVDESGFSLVGLSAAERAEAVTVIRNEDDRSEVIVGFEPGTDVASFTLGVVDTGAVVNVDGETNPPDSHSLGGTSVELRDGRTIGPDLIGLRRQPSVERAVFLFDEDVDDDEDPDPRDFGYYTPSGTVHRGDAVLSIDNQAVTVAFSEAEGNQVSEGIRFFVLAGALTDRNGADNPYWEIGAETARPDLEDVDAQGDGAVWEFRFDDEVTDADPSRFLVVSAGGVTIRADDVARSEDDSVLVLFEDAEDFAEEIVLGVALPGAVRADDASGTGSTLSVEPVDAEELGDGPTIGPDLEDVDVDEDSGLVRYLFDEEIDDDEEVDPRDFAVITESGELVVGQSVVESDDEFVIVVFRSSDVEAAEAFTVSTGAVQDELGHGNPLRTVGG